MPDFQADELIVPPGKATGLLLRDDKPGEFFPLAPERIDVIPVSDWPSLLDEDMTLRQFVKVVYDQNGNGSCASEAMNQGTAIVQHAAGAPYVEFNPLFVYGRVNGGRDAGSSISANLRFGQRYGCCPESVWPRAYGWRRTPSDEAYAAAANHRIGEIFEVGNWEEFGSALLKGCPVVWGYRGHSITAVKLLSTTRFVYVNSWGQWGDGGFASVSKDSIYWPYGAYAIRTTTPTQDLPK